MVRKKIGEVLIEKGVLTEKQLENALKAQLIVGGHLGTSLLELGLIDEATLGRALSESFGVPHAPAEALQEIPETTIAIVPAKVAEDYKVIPFRVTDKVLHMAMVDPGNLPAVDVLSFATDMRIVPWVTPELRIYQALEHYYGIPRRLRYIGICNALDSPPRTEGSQRNSSAVGSGSHSSDEPVRPVVSMNPSADIDQELSFNEELGFDYGRTWHEVAAELKLDEPAGPSDPGPSPPAPVSTLVEAPPRPASARLELTDIADQLCRADTREDVAEAIFAYTGTRMARGILFGVQKQAATPWRSRGFPVDRLPQVRIPLASGIFELLLGNELYRGLVPREAKYETSYRMLKVERPSEILMVPLYLSDRLVAIFYGDGGARGRVTGETEDYLRLFRLFSPTLNLLILKNKIRDAAHPAPEVRKKLQTV